MLIEFSKIEFQNYKTIKKGFLTLSDKGVVLIQGINNDKGGSNGAGKSTIQNGLLWCLYDRTLVGKETEKEILPKFIKKKEFTDTGGCRVTVNFKRDGVGYEVSRYKKNPIYKNTATILQEDEFGKYVEFTKCTDKETNSLIEEIVGADFQSFVHSNIWSFNNTESFLKRNDKDKKELVLPRYLVDMFKKVYKECGEEIKEIEGTIQNFGDKILENTVILPLKHHALTEIEQDIRARDEDLKNIEEKLNSENKSKKVLEEKLALYNTNMSVYKDKISKFEIERMACEKTLQEWTDIVFVIASLTHTIANTERDINIKKLELEQYKKKDKPALLSKIVELSKDATIKTEAYGRLENSIEACRKELSLRVDTLNDILETKKSVEASIVEEDKGILRLNEMEIAATKEKKSLISQRDNIETKYYSEECKTCPSNKMKVLFKDTDRKIAARTFLINTLKSDQVHVEKCKQANFCKKLEEVKVFEVTCRSAVDEIQKGELVVLEQEIFSVQQELRNIKNTITEINHSVDNSSEILRNIAEIDSTIKDLTKILGESQFKASKLQEKCPSDKVKHFTSLRDKLFLKIVGEDTKKTVGLQEVSDVRVELSSIESSIGNLEASLIVTDDLEKKRDKINEEIFDSTSKRALLIEQQEILGKKLEILKFWKVGFSPAGIEGFMMDSLVNVMNSLIAKYLSYLSNGTIALTLIPDSTLKSGDTRNKISEKVENDSGGPTYRGNSEGEKRIMDIAVLFALKYIYEQMTGTKYNILFCDEAFDTLDASTSYLVVNLINTLENIASIFVVSHVDFIALEFDSFIKMVKTKGISEIMDNDDTQ